MVTHYVEKGVTGQLETTEGGGRGCPLSGRLSVGGTGCWLVVGVRGVDPVSPVDIHRGHLTDEVFLPLVQKGQVETRSHGPYVVLYFRPLTHLTYLFTD